MKNEGRRVEVGRAAEKTIGDLRSSGAGLRWVGVLLVVVAIPAGIGSNNVMVTVTCVCAGVGVAMGGLALKGIAGIWGALERMADKEGK